MDASTYLRINRTAASTALLATALVFSLSASAACPSGQTELLPNIRALPPHTISMLDASNMRFGATSWNSGAAKLELVARNPVTDPDGQVRQPVDQRIYCSGGAFYDRSAGKAEYHAAHNHVHYNDYANYILERADGTTQNPRKGTKTTFCIMDNSGVNTQLRGASGSAVFNWCPTQDPSFNMQGMSVGWGDTYAANLPGQSLLIGDLAPGMYRLRHVFDPKNLIAEQSETDNESCKLIEIGDGLSGRYATDRGPCLAPPAPTISSIVPGTAKHGTCVQVTVTGTNLVPELRLFIGGGTGPMPSIRTTSFSPVGNYVNAEICVPRAKGGGNKPQLGSNPNWDISASSAYTASSNILVDRFRVTP